ncbi:MAG: biotin--[acetyl-CoA-carboxylase] ligase [Deltaproteobacteria bacterium]|nr:biotin--[acetyl-CoA-carboxylase] ligase [Deltaproteobacteria bacterium]
MRIREIVELDETTSTQDVAIARARAGDAGGLVVVAGAQTAGRGRGGRVWESPRGVNLYASLLVREALSPDLAHRPMMATAIAALETVRGAGVANARIKWPNDVVVGGRKLAGILAESSVAGGRVEWVVVGVGLNVNWLDIPTDLKGVASSLAIEIGRALALDDVRAQLMSAWERALDVADPYDEWCAGSLPVGERVTVHAGDRVVVGRIAGYDHSGALILERDDGACETLSAGDLVRGA